MLLRDKKPSIIFIAHPMMVFMPRTIQMWAVYTLIWKYNNSTVKMKQQINEENKKTKTKAEQKTKHTQQRAA